MLHRRRIRRRRPARRPGCSACGPGPGQTQWSLRLLWLAARHRRSPLPARPRAFSHMVAHIRQTSALRGTADALFFTDGPFSRRPPWPGRAWLGLFGLGPSLLTPSSLPSSSISSSLFGTPGPSLSLSRVCCSSLLPAQSWASGQQSSAQSLTAFSKRIYIPLVFFVTSYVSFWIFTFALGIKKIPEQFSDLR